MHLKMKRIQWLVSVDMNLVLKVKELNSHSKMDNYELKNLKLHYLLNPTGFNDTIQSTVSYVYDAKKLKFQQFSVNCLNVKNRTISH